MELQKVRIRQELLTSKCKTRMVIAIDCAAIVKLTTMEVFFTKLHREQLCNDLTVISWRLCIITWTKLCLHYVYILTIMLYRLECH